MRTPFVAGACLALVALTGCTDNNPATGTGAITVSSTADECQVEASEAPSGNLVFRVTNNGSQVTEFYLYAQDGLRIIGEVENIGPGLTRDLVVRAEPGQYETACKPGMKGRGIRGDFTVTDSGKHDQAVAGVDQQLVQQANAQYGLYVKDQTDQLVQQTQRFVDLYKAGRDDQARALYPLARVHWERIEPVAESFGDLDPRMDLREADLTPGQRWTGWHRIEKDLWPPKSGAGVLTQAQRVEVADQLMADTRELDRRTSRLTFTVDQIANGSKTLLDEVATGKVTGEEEVWSHTDLYDFQANVDGARVAYEGLQPVLKVKDPALDMEIGQRFDELQRLLDRYRVGERRFVPYTQLSQAEVKQLSDAVNALSEPLSKLAAAVTL